MAGKRRPCAPVTVIGASMTAHSSVEPEKNRDCRADQFVVSIPYQVLNSREMVWIRAARFETNWEARSLISARERVRSEMATSSTAETRTQVGAALEPLLERYMN